VVLAVDDHRVTIGVDDREVPASAAALTAGGVVLALTPR
jgi:hypothetical protein